MHANKEGTVIQNEYSYVLGGMESHDMYMYARHSLFVLWQHIYVISIEKPIDSNKNHSISIQNLKFRSRHQVSQVHNFEVLNLLHI